MLELKPRAMIKTVFPGEWDEISANPQKPEIEKPGELTRPDIPQEDRQRQRCRHRHLRGPRFDRKAFLFFQLEQKGK